MTQSKEKKKSYSFFQSIITAAFYKGYTDVSVENTDAVIFAFKFSKENGSKLEITIMHQDLDKPVITELSKAKESEWSLIKDSSTSMIRLFSDKNKTLI